MSTVALLHEHCANGPLRKLYTSPTSDDCVLWMHRVMRGLLKGHEGSGLCLCLCLSLMMGSGCKLIVDVLCLFLGLYCKLVVFCFVTGLWLVSPSRESLLSQSRQKGPLSHRHQDKDQQLQQQRHLLVPPRTRSPAWTSSSPTPSPTVRERRAHTDTQLTLSLVGSGLHSFPHEFEFGITLLASMLTHTGI